MTDEEFSEILALGYERRGVEFKGPGPLEDKQLRARVVRAMLGMANRRDGGLVIIGVEDDRGNLKPTGLNPSDLSTWKYDDVADKAAEYADPTLGFELEIRELQGSKFVVLRVHEFEDVPVLCRKDFDDVLRRGACYVRSRRKPETAEVPRQEDMRDLLELATEKRLRAYAKLRTAESSVGGPATPSDNDLFEQQLKRFL